MGFFFLNESDGAQGRPYVTNVEETTKENNNYRTTVWTGENLQLTVMSIEPDGDIGIEVHNDEEQIIRIEQGRGQCVMGDSKDEMDFKIDVETGDVIFVPKGKWHNIVNTAKYPLKLNSIYGPAHHDSGTVHETKDEAMLSEDTFFDTVYSLTENLFSFDNDEYLSESILSDFREKIKERKQKKKDAKDKGKVIVETEYTFKTFNALFVNQYTALDNLNRGLNRGSKNMDKAPIFVNEINKRMTKNGKKEEIRLLEEDYKDILESTADTGRFSLVAMFGRMKKDAMERYKELNDIEKKMNKNKNESYVRAMDFLSRQVKDIHKSYKSGYKGKVGE